MATGHPFRSAASFPARREWARIEAFDMPIKPARRSFSASTGSTGALKLPLRAIVPSRVCIVYAAVNLLGEKSHLVGDT
jgi:hypothetical protein